MNQNQHFDVVICGTHLGGLIASCLLAKNGKRVGLLVDQPYATVPFKNYPFLIPNGPSYFGHLNESGIVAQVHNLLGCTPLWRNHQQTLQPSYQVILPSARLNISHNRFDLQRHLSDYFSSAMTTLALQFIDGILALNQQLQVLLTQKPFFLPRYRWQRWWQRWWLRELWPFAGAFSQHPLWYSLRNCDLALKQALLAPLTFLGTIQDSSLSVLHAVRTLAAAYQGITTLKTGCISLRQFFADLATNLGVLKLESPQLTLHPNHCGFKIATGKKSICTSTAVVWNDSRALSTALATEHNHHFWEYWEAEAAPKSWVVASTLLVRRRVLPLALAPLALLFATGDNQTPLWLQTMSAMPPSTWVTTPNAQCPEIVHPELAVLQLFRSVNQSEWQQNQQPMLYQQMRGQLRELIPFVDDFIVSETQLAPVPRYFYGLPKEHVLGVVSRPFTTPISNLYLAGPDTVTGLGDEGAYHAAMNIQNQL